MRRTPHPMPLAAAAAILLLAACGGGGDDDAGGDGRPSVASASVTGAKYSQTALVTINGTNLDGSTIGGTITVVSPGCTGMTRSTTAPNVSSATTAYYTCTVKAVGAQTVTVARASDNSTLFTQPFSVPAPQVTMTVSNGAAVGGSMVITLAPDKTPITVDNFLRYVNTGFYDGTIFHRVVSGFVIQGGGYLPITTLPPVAKAGTFAPIALEVNKGLSNLQWTIAMARLSGNGNSATSQFFINLQNNSKTLDPHSTPLSTSDDMLGYAVFGSITINTALVSAIVGAPCAAVAGFSECAPNPNMLITKAEQTL